MAEPNFLLCIGIFFLTLLEYHIDVAVLVSAVEQSDSVIHIHISMSTLF